MAAMEGSRGQGESKSQAHKIKILQCSYGIIVKEIHLVIKLQSTGYYSYSILLLQESTLPHTSIKFIVKSVCDDICQQFYYAMVYYFFYYYYC